MVSKVGPILTLRDVILIFPVSPEPGQSTNKTQKIKMTSLCASEEPLNRLYVANLNRPYVAHMKPREVTGDNKKAREATQDSIGKLVFL